MESVIGVAAMAAVPAYWVLQTILAKRYEGGWRLAAKAPLLVMLPVLFYTMFALFQGSNLWPLLLILASPLACIYLGVLAAVRAST